MLQKIKLYIKNNPEKILYIFSLLYTITIGVLLSYNYDLNDNYNLLFDSDTKRIIIDMTEILGNHYRSNVHPLFILFIQPIYLIINGIIQNKSLAIITILSFVSSFTVLLLNRILNKTNKNKKMNLIISLIYLFSFSNIIFTTSPETYSFSALTLLLLWYYYINKKDKYNTYSYIILIILGILSFSFTITNIAIFFIVLMLLLIEKKINVKNSLKIVIVLLIAITGLNIGQKVIWNNTSLYFKTSIKEEKSNYSNTNSCINKILNVVKDDYINPIMASDVELNVKYSSTYNEKNYIINFSKTNILNIIILSIFYIITILLIIRNAKKNVIINIGLLLSLGFNTMLHIIYGNDGAFLYSEHFLYLIILLFGINYNKEENSKLKKYINIYLPILLIIEIINNNLIFNKILSFVNNIIKPTYFVSHLGLSLTILLELVIIIISISIVTLIIYLIRNIKKENNLEKKQLLKISLIGLVILFECIFITINSVEQNNRFLILDLNNDIKEFIPKNKQYYTNKTFKNYFKEELKSLEEYQNEIIELKKEYDFEEISNISWNDNYYFGLANRKKLIYTNNKLINVETKEVIKEFDVKEQFIIPNIYTVIIETNNNDYIKIYEDSDGIHYIENKKEELLDDNKINLYDFSNQKYQNIKKELYGELLFNIKNETIYPNILVYDKPWYRDAALTCMVLKQTNNTDLIDEWVNNITEIYDMQNANIKEPDNLGELLYIISTQENRNEELIDRIEEEAKSIAESNKDGYFLYGQTDFKEQYLYQNLWYKLGIESVGRNFNFNLSIIPEDEYSKMAWWSNYQPKGNNITLVSEDYPYLSYATYHKLKNGKIPINKDIYPLSWEKNASQANYNNYNDIDTIMTMESISQIHAWSTSELLLLLLDETGNLNQ